MGRPLVAFNIQEWAEVAVIVLAHHLVRDHFLQRFFSNRKSRDYFYLDVHILGPVLDCSFFFWQQEHSDLAILCRRVVFPVDAAVRAPWDAAEFFHLFSCMHCHSTLSGRRSSYFKNSMS